jgi:hypothetical protein
MVYQKKFEKYSANNTRTRFKKTKKKIVVNEMKVFENFIITLFDPLYFKLLYKNNPANQIEIADLKFEYAYKGAQARVSIRCFYVKKLVHADPVLIEMTELSVFIAHSVEKGFQPYYILGVGGLADDPADIFLIPLQDVKTKSLSYSQLLTFKKSGMFYYHAELKQLK